MANAAVTGPGPGPLAVLGQAAEGPRRMVEVVDIPAHRLRRPSDLVTLTASALAIGLVLLLSVYAHRTTDAVTEDVQSALSGALARVLIVPLNLIEGLAVLVLPTIVLGIRLWHLQVRVVVEALAAAVLAGLIAAGTVWALDNVGPDALAAGLQVGFGSQRLVTIPPYAAAVSALLTAVGARDRRRSVAWTWNLLWATLVLQVLAGGLSLPGAIIAVLIGRVVGLGIRYASGVRGERAYGQALVVAMRRAGIDPVRVERLADPGTLSGAQRSTLSTDAPIGYTNVPRDRSKLAETDERSAVEANAAAAPGGPTSPASERPTSSAATASTSTATLATAGGPGQEVTGGESHPTADTVPVSATLAPEREGANRVYAVTDAEGVRWDVVVLDGDRQVVGALAAVWSSIRLRGIERRTLVSLRAAAEQTALMTFAASSAGVRTPGLRGIADEQDSVLLVGQHIPSAGPLKDLEADQIGEAVLDDAWRQLRAAHHAGLAHHDVSDESLLVTADERVWLTNWAKGEVASSDLARTIDLAQMLALLALRVGPERALASATRALSEAEIVSIAPVLQPVALPGAIRAEARKNRAVLNELRDLLVERIPTADVEPVRLSRFSVRTMVTASIAALAVVVLLTTFNLEQVVDAVQGANATWLLVAFGLGLLTYLGSGMTLVAFSPERLSLGRAVLVQVAASVVVLITPAGVGPAGMNLRFLQRNRVETPMALATVALVQVSQFATTILLLLGIALVTGSSGALNSLPSGAVLIAFAATLGAVGASFAFPAVRRWAVERIAPTLRQIWPRLVWVVGQPTRLVLGVGGNAIQTAGYIAAFAAVLAAFGQSVPLTSLALIQLAGTAAGSAIPTPGGAGTVELALTSGLRTAGMATGVAASAAVVFRLVTFWARVPLGWVALRYLQRRELI